MRECEDSGQHEHIYTDRGGSSTPSRGGVDVVMVTSTIVIEFSMMRLLETFGSREPIREAHVRVGGEVSGCCRDRPFRTGIGGSSGGCCGFIISTLEGDLGGGDFSGVLDWLGEGTWGSQGSSLWDFWCHGQVGAGHTEAKGIGHIVLGLHLAVTVYVVVRSTDDAEGVTGLSAGRRTASEAEGVLTKFVLRVVLGLDGHHRGERGHV
ncbi:hypothetical protein Hamer_G014339, partial [Homarus americanus]